MRFTIKHIIVLCLVDLIIWMSAILPAHALVSTTGYARVASQSAMNAMLTAQRSLTLSTAGATISAASAGSVAVRLVTGPVGWLTLGVAAGVVIAELVLSPQEVADIKTASGSGPSLDIVGYPEPAGTESIICTGVGAPHVRCVTGNEKMLTALTQNCSAINPFNPIPAGWASFGVFETGPTCPTWFKWGLIWQGPDNAPVVVPGTPGTAQQVTDYLNALPAGDPKSFESNTTKVGTETQATPADSQVSLPLASTDVATSVVPSGTVSPTDTVLNPNATATPGTPTTQTQETTSTTESTTTTTTTTNPDGSTTTTETRTETEEASASCSAGTHDQRTFGGVLQAHMTAWQGSGLLSALNVLKTLTWPETMPSYQLNSTIMGTFNVDFTQWSGMLLALRGIIIALSSFVAYRIVFVGSK